MPDIALTTQKFPLAVIKPNPWQTRNGHPDPTYIAELADDIEAHGLQQVPRGRVRNDGKIELLFGHNRLEAFKLLAQRHTIVNDKLPEQNPKTYVIWDEMPVDVVDATDHEMAVAAIIENSQRRDLTAIEKAHALQRYMHDFKKSQLEAGKLFGIQTQGAVSNLLRLLKLPAQIQDLVSAGSVPERIARQLITYAQIDAKAASAMAQSVAKAGDNEKDQAAHNAIDNFQRQHGKWLHPADVPWKSLDWPPAPMSVDNPAIKTIPACAGCPFLLKPKYGNPVCLSKTCYAVKTQVWAQAEAERVATKLKLTTGPSIAKERLEVVYAGNGKDEPLALKALATRHPSLRIAPYIHAGAESWQASHDRERVLGSKWVALCTVDRKALDVAISKVKLPKEAKVLVERKQKLDRWQAQQKKREEQKRKLLARDRALIRSAAPHLARVLPTGALLQIIYNKVGFGITDSQRKAWPKASDPERQAILMECLLADHANVTSYSAPEPARVATKVVTLAKQLKLKLPRGWNEVQQPKPSKNGKK